MYKYISLPKELSYGQVLVKINYSGICGSQIGEIDGVKGGLVVQPRGELPEFTNGPERTILFRVRYGDSMTTRTKNWPTNPKWKPTEIDLEYFS